MSLPTYMVMYNIYGDKMGDSFVNAGWWIDAQGLYDILVPEFPSVVFTKPNVAYVELYDFTFFIEMIQDFRSIPKEDVIKVLQRIIDTSNEEYRNDQTR